MCLILFGYHTHPRYAVVLAANRDEFYNRPTAPMGYWEDHRQILAGRDLKMMGTWFGITPAGRWAAITNYRQPDRPLSRATSRGHLISDYLKGQECPAGYLQEMASRADHFSGFNILTGDPKGLHYFSNRGDAPRELAAGIYGLSNHLLNSPWPKVNRGTRDLAGLLENNGKLSANDLLDLLQNLTPAPDDQLPDTGVGLEWERRLSPMFISSPDYGTLASTVMTIDGQGRVEVTEVTWQPGKTPPKALNRQTYRFTIEPQTC